MQDITETLKPVVDVTFDDIQQAKVGDQVSNGVVTDVQHTTDEQGNAVQHTTVSAALTAEEKAELEENLAATEDFLHFVFDNDSTANLFMTKLFANERFVDSLFNSKYFQQRMAQFSVDIFTRTLHQMEMASQNRLAFEFVAGPVETGNEGELTVAFTRDDQGSINITEVTLGGRDVKASINPTVQTAITNATISLALEYTDIDKVYGVIVTSEKPEVTESALNSMIDGSDDDQIDFDSKDDDSTSV